jgi:hypothetical protein
VPGSPKNRTSGFHRIRLKQAVACPAARRRTIRSTRSGSSAGPFTTTVVEVSNLSVGSGVIVVFSCWAHLIASARSCVRAPGPVSGQLSVTTSGRGLANQSRFPAAFRPPAFASRSSCSRREFGRSSRSAYRPQGAGPRRGYRVPHARAMTGVGALYTPRTTVLAPIWGTSPAGVCRTSTARPSTPLQHPFVRGSA